jgi:hypothetical protein
LKTSEKIRHVIEVATKLNEVIRWGGQKTRMEKNSMKAETLGNKEVKRHSPAFVSASYDSFTRKLCV